MSIPVLFAIDPASASADGGTLVTISGQGLLDTTRVTFGGLDAASFAIDDDSQISAETPSGMAEGNVDVIVGSAEGDSDPFVFTVFASNGGSPAQSLSIDAVEPSELDPAGGEILTITGAGLDSVVDVSIDGTAVASLSLESPERLSVETPVLAIDGEVSLVVATPTASASEPVTVAARCTVTAFNVPVGRSGCVTAGPKRGERFRMEADFGGSCSCCEYRQLVRGTFTANGRTVRHLLPDPAGGPPRPMLGRPGAGDPGDNFREDGVAFPPSGINRFYGHRSEGDTDPSDRYLPDRASGCQYRGSDFPGLAGATGTTYSIELDFRGSIVDSCRSEAVKNTADWTVSCSGVI